MEVRDGYKKTEIGVIPEDWDVVSVDKNFDFYQNNTYSRDCMNEKGGDIQNIHYGDILIKYGSILDCDKENIPFLNMGISVSLSNRTVQSGDIIITDTAEDSTVGKAIEVINIKGRKVVSGLHTIFIRPHAGLFAERYLGYFFNAPIYHNQLLPYIVGIKVSSISKKTIRNTMILRPCLEEQQAIAEVLSDVDSLISSLTKLISKKKKIKQGVMQELLTGEKRLEGFNGEWKIMHVSNIGKTYGGLAGKTKADFGHGNSKYIPFMNVMSNPVIDMGFLENVKIADGEFQNNVKMGDLFFNTSSETPEEVGMCSVLLEDVDNLYLNSFCFGFRVNDLSSFYPLYLSYFFRSDVGRKLMFSLAQGATRYNLSKNYFNKLRVALPGIEEQIAIANIISDMDAEIEALEQKLSKYKAIKQGMMHELLTGRIRLV